MKSRQSSGSEFKQKLEPLIQQADYSLAYRVVKRLQDAGHVAVFAGGCVRDGLLGQNPKDLDIATSALPEVVEELFARTLAVGKAFGTIVVVEESSHFEVTTFRTEGLYEDGRRPQTVRFTDMREDALRRDFTVNALFYDPSTDTVYDFVGGLDDLRARRLRTVGLASERFHEDRLRMLRALRFVSQLGFRLDPEALEGIRSFGHEITTIAPERILAEMQRFLCGDYLNSGFQVLQLSGLETHFWPEVKALSLSRLGSFPQFQSWENAFAACHWLTDQIETASHRLKAWRASRESLRRVEEQLAAAATLLSETSSRAERVRAMGSDTYADLLVLVSGLLKLNGSESRLQDWLSDYLKVATVEGGLPAPFVTGQDLLALGVRPGPEMGEQLRRIYDRQLEGEWQSRDQALMALQK